MRRNIELYMLFAVVIAVGACTNDNTANSSTEAKLPVSTNTAQTSGRTSVIDSLTQLINTEGATSYLLSQRAKYYLAYQNVEAARNDINTARSLDTNVAELNEVHGELHYMLNRTREARNEWENCLKKDPNNSVCLMKLTELMIAVKNYDKAMNYVNRQIEIDPNDAQAYFAKGIIVRDRFQDTALALQYFQNAIDLNQNYVEAIDMMAVTLTAQKDTLAKFYYDRLLDMQPNNAELYFKLGVYHMNLKNINGALEAYTKAIQINPNYADCYYNLAFIFIELNDYAQARANFTNAINNQERNYKAYYGRGFTHEVVGDIANAKKDYQTALDILPIYKPAAEALERLSR